MSRRDGSYRLGVEFQTERERVSTRVSNCHGLVKEIWETDLTSHLTFFWNPLYNFCNNMFCIFANVILYKK